MSNEYFQYIFINCRKKDQIWRIFICTNFFKCEDLELSGLSTKSFSESSICTALSKLIELKKILRTFNKSLRPCIIDSNKIRPKSLTGWSGGLPINSVSHTSVTLVVISWPICATTTIWRRKTYNDFFNDFIFCCTASFSFKKTSNLKNKATAADYNLHINFCICFSYAVLAISLLMCCISISQF